VQHGLVKLAQPAARLDTEVGDQGGPGGRVGGEGTGDIAAAMESADQQLPAAFPCRSGVHMLAQQRQYTIGPTPSHLDLGKCLHSRRSLVP